ncbi:hypothetical protein MRX96_012765 [Rhipicephalus microplus]
MMSSGPDKKGPSLPENHSRYLSLLEHVLTRIHDRDLPPAKPVPAEDDDALRSMRRLKKQRRAFKRREFTAELPV